MARFLIFGNKKVCGAQGEKRDLIDRVREMSFSAHPFSSRNRAVAGSQRAKWRN
ncbi:hypothetical protein ACQR16_01250 [Bradyrhizobium oligotrophicum]|uniref:hypothetical protein n=1 Tax=Bradyrhizobium oligotrophicum TaxID=44255 RepID=UPI003EBEFF92